MAGTTSGRRVYRAYQICLKKGINIIGCWMLYYEEARETEKDYASVLANTPLHSYEGECTYCGHCKPCPVDLDIAMINKYYDLAIMQPEVPATIKSHYMLLEHKASECLECHACETRCPFNVSISERMKKAKELFGE